MGPSAPASGSEDIDYPLHDHEQIEARLGELRLSGFSPEDAAFFANGLISFCRNAEEALAECIQHLDESTLSRELAAHVFTDWRRRSSPNESQADLRHRILAELKARQIVVVASDEWSVALPDGTQLEQLLSPVAGDSSVLRLARLALLAAGIVTMRDHPNLMPSY